MSTNYPAALDNNTTLPNPAAGNFTNSPSHAGQHGNVNDAVKATQAKLGTGSSTPAAATLLIGTGAGTSAWTAITSAQLAAVLSDETGSGSNVFANTPTLITPKVDTINENTSGNGVTIDGVLLKDGLIATSALANRVDTAALQTSSVSGDKIATYRVVRQNNTSNTSETTARILTGWGVIDGTGASSVQETVTFNSAFTSIPIVTVSFGGDTTSLSTTYGAGTVAVNAAFGWPSSITTSSFLARVQTTGGNWTTSQSVFYQWTAIGA